MARRQSGKQQQEPQAPPFVSDPLDLDVPSLAAVRDAVRNLIQQLGACGGYWLEPQRGLSNWVDESRNLPLDEQATALERLNRRLAFIVNRSKPDLSRTQAKQLEKFVYQAVEACQRYIYVLPSEMKQHDRIFRKVREVYEAAIAESDKSKQVSTKGGPVVSKNGKLILGALLATNPTLQGIEEICGTLSNKFEQYLSERTVGPELKALIEAGLAVRPNGKGKGAILTPAGKAQAEKLRD